MKKNNLLFLFLFLLPSILGFSQTEYFDPLDELGSGYGSRNINEIKDNEINFPSSSEEDQPTNKQQRIRDNVISTNTKDKLKALINRTQQQAYQHEDNSQYAQVYSYDAEATNFDRFHNSPCYDEIGFNPTSDLTSLEKSYCDCESKKNLKIAMNVLFIFVFAVIIGIVFYLSRKKTS